MNTSYDFYYRFVFESFNAWYECVLKHNHGRQIDRDTFLAYIGGGEL